MRVSGLGHKGSVWVGHPVSMSGPNLTRRQLGRRLRTLREQSGISPGAIASEPIELMSTSKLYRLENGQQPKPHYPDVKELCELYGHGPASEITKELVRMAKACLQAGWWEPFGSGVPAWFQLYLELEQITHTIRVYEVAYVTGLLQTEATMRALLAANPALDPDTVEQTVEARLRRQRHFTARNPAPRLELAIDEGALRRVVGGPDAHAEQLAHLREANARPNISVHVLPAASGAYAGQGQPFTLMEFPDPLDPSVVYSEAATGAHYDESAGAFGRRLATFGSMIGQAVPLEEFQL
ncbi:transcriptional regulator [Actinorhabdospora filicis]|uniref:Transcriptional regulator n=1 Tax=Actinorhabdospora filicis TaxID=1785913 RepID=A0A9W6SJV1_9ACTN|nr:transcriptional regulator [Actinorhabdospora filicis]